MIYDPVRTRKALSELFGFDSFRPHQETIIRSILEGKDSFVVMPTGGGKSLCYQLPAILMPGTAIVVSPLIALMKDQVDAARMIGVRAAFLNSSLSPAERSEISAALASGELDLLYVAPERFSDEGFLAALDRSPPAFFAVDEAHCISEWGHDFRPDYLKLGILTERFGSCPVAAFTATATAEVQSNTIERLGLRTPHIVRASFDRPNLRYSVVRKEHVDEQLRELIRTSADFPVIVYRTTRKDVEHTASYLVSCGVPALPYHAGLDRTIRTENQERFVRDEVRVVVATVAFGMGIDKSNVRLVIHGDLPKGVEQYYQESGRAGRDGEDARCVLLYSGADVQRSRRFIADIDDEKERNRAQRSLERMVRYATTVACRRHQILRYFGETPLSDGCGVCDVCTGDLRSVDATIHARIALSAVYRTGERFGAKHVVDVIRGASTEKIRNTGHDRLKTFGAGSANSVGYWRSLIDELVTQRYLVQSEGAYPTLSLDERCRPLLRGEQRFSISEWTVERDVDSPSPAGVPIDPEQYGIFERLRAARKRIASEEAVPAYVVLSDRTLKEIARVRPGTLDALRHVHGIGARKLEKYGTMILEVVNR